jgi:hypothetical protein
MTCIYRAIHSTILTGIGNTKAIDNDAICKVKQSNLDDKIMLCNLDAQLGLSSMLSYSCQFNNENDHLCPRRA